MTEWGCWNHTDVARYPLLGNVAVNVYPWQQYMHGIVNGLLGTVLACSPLQGYMQTHARLAPVRV